MTNRRCAREVMNDVSQPIDVLLLDYRLPDEVLQNALDRGAYCVVAKPFDMGDVEPLVRDAVQAMRPH